MTIMNLEKDVEEDDENSVGESDRETVWQTEAATGEK